MARTVAIGIQNYADLIEKNYFYIDKTAFIREWWEKGDSVTLITRPRRFGKTLNLSMVESFFSNRYAGRSDLFENMDIWKTASFQELQGTYPVISLSFASIKETSFDAARRKINQLLVNLYADSVDAPALLGDAEREWVSRVTPDMDEMTASLSLYQLSRILHAQCGRRVLILLDEYDTPLHEAYANGYWQEFARFIRNLFNAAFKTNPYMERALMTGITRVSRESMFSDLNNLSVVTTSSDHYADSFGFTEGEVFAAMDEMGLKNREQVRSWYDGFIFGNERSIYNPWSIINYLATGKIELYWTNTSENRLVSRLVQQSDINLKMNFETLLQGGSIRVRIDEQIVYSDLDHDASAVWSLLLAAGYLKTLSKESYADVAPRRPSSTLAITNREIQTMFSDMFAGWFQQDSSFGEFMAAMLKGDERGMSRYLNRIAQQTFSYFDTGREPERFYHGFVLGLLAESAADYVMTSNRESGYGRYDTVLEPRDPSCPAVILEFKALDTENGENNLSEAADRALKQIAERGYAAELVYRGIPKEQILSYGLAFRGKECEVKMARGACA